MAAMRFHTALLGHLSTRTAAGTIGHILICCEAGFSWRSVMSASGLTQLPSRHSARETIDCLESEIKSRGLTVFARIDHAAGAKDVGMALRPTELLIFGNAKGGTPLMQACQTIGIDLPLKALAWEDADGKVWLSYNEPAWLVARHGAAQGLAETAQRLATLLATVAKAAGS
jgi:uncharacterized protein (DUF302 family)